MNFIELVKTNMESLSKGQRKVADYMINNVEIASYSTLAKISREADVSETTVIRFSYSLGFESFSDMQTFLQKELLGAESNKVETLGKKEYFNSLLENEIKILSDLNSDLNSEDVFKAIEKIHQADAVLSVGGRAIYPASLWFGMALDRVRDMVYELSPDGENFFRNLMIVNDKSVLVCVSFSRYSKKTYQFAKIAKDKGAFIISITDSTISPLAMISDISFITKPNVTDSGINTISSATALLNVLVVGYVKRYPEEASKRIKELESLYKETEDLIFE